MQNSKLQFKIQNYCKILLFFFTFAFYLLSFDFVSAASFEFTPLEAECHAARRGDECQTVTNAGFNAPRELLTGFTEPQSPMVIGDTIRVPVYIDAGDEFVSIADLRIVFPRESLWAKSFTVAPGWLIAPDEEYNSIDNGRGTLRATAGFEGSFSGRMPFGMLEFVAVGPGIAEIGVAPDSMILNARNENMATSSNTLTPRIVIASLESAAETPTQLFDIGLLLEHQVFSPEDPITFRAHFNSFGTVPTPVEMFFTVTDESGKIVTTSHESLVVETDAVFTKRFERLDLPPGAYEMHMHTRYNVNVEDDFHISFSVRRSVGERYLFGGAALSILVAIIIYGFWSRRKSPR